MKTCADKERYLVATNPESNAVYYHLLSKELWDEYGNQCEMKSYYDRQYVMNDMLLRCIWPIHNLPPDEYNKLVAEIDSQMGAKDPSLEYNLFLMLTRFMSFV